MVGQPCLRPPGRGDQGLECAPGFVRHTRLPFWAEVRGQSGDWGAQPDCPPAHIPELKGGTAGTTPGPGGPQSRGAALLGTTLDPEGKEETFILQTLQVICKLLGQKLLII